MADTKMVTPGALDKLAKLLAAENIMVEHRPIKTAYFDVKNRVLALPMWKEMTETLYHMLVLHEVGHALETPADGWKGSIDKVKERDGARTGDTFQGYLNVVEDARIERKVKLKFPGSRRDFIEGYDWLHDQDFFSVKNRDIQQLPLIDRINLYFKIGTRSRILFTEEEQVFVRRAEQTITFAEVVQLAEDIFAYAKKKNEDQQEEQTLQIIAEDGEGDEGDEFEFDNETDSDDNGEEGDGDTESSSTKKDVNAADNESDRSEGGNNSDPMDHGGLESLTDRSMNDRMEELLDESVSGREFQYLMFPKDISYEPFTYTYKDILSWIDSDFSKAKNYAMVNGYRTYLLNNFRRDNNNAINYMVKEFEMKKAAVAYSRSKQAKTGVIDTNKLHSYKFSDDIFKRLTIEPTGKNHGVVAILDMSGSMSNSFRGAMDQLICLAMFCRRVGIPHRFYGFTSAVSPSYFDGQVKTKMHAKQQARSVLKANIHARLKKPFVFPESDFDLIELFHEDMNLKEFNTMVGTLLLQATRFGSGYYSSYTDEYVTKAGYGTSYELLYNNIPSAMTYFSLGGTPLNDALITSRDLLRKFRKEKNIQIMNYITITDGESNLPTYIDMYGKRQSMHYTPSKNMTRIFIDEESRMQTTIGFQSSVDVTGMFARIVRDSQEAKFVGFYIVSSAYDIRNAIYRYVPYAQQEKMRNQMSKEGSVVISNMINFHEFYLIRGGKNLEAQQAKFDEAKEMTKGQLARAFIGAQNKRGASRVILGRFIDKIAS